MMVERDRLPISMMTLTPKNCQQKNITLDVINIRAFIVALIVVRLFHW